MVKRLSTRSVVRRPALQGIKTLWVSLGRNKTLNSCYVITPSVRGKLIALQTNFCDVFSERSHRDDDENSINRAGLHNMRQMYLSLSVHCSNKQKHMANYYAEWHNRSFNVILKMVSSPAFVIKRASGVITICKTNRLIKCKIFWLTHRRLVKCVLPVTSMG